MTEALFYELMTNEKDRAQCFSKLPPVDNPVDLVLHPGGFFQKEIGTRRPSPKPSSCILQFRYQFNPGLSSSDFQIPSPQKESLLEWRDSIYQEVQSLWGTARHVPENHPQLFAGSDESRRSARAELEHRIARDSGLILGLYGKFRAPKGYRKYPPSRLLSEHWFLYRWVQVRWLFSIDTAVRYRQFLGGDIPASISEKLEHDVLDAQYLMIGIHQGAFATQEAKLAGWFKLVRPDGRLLNAGG